MKHCDIIIDFKIGIHSRPAALLVRKVRSYPDCTITFVKNGRIGRGDSLIEILQLGVVEGSKVTVCVEGADEDRVLSELVSYIKKELAGEV